MERELLIPDINPNTTHWKARVLVLEKTTPYQAGRGHRLQKLIVMDEQGNKARGLIWNSHIDALRDRIRPLKTYYLRGVYVQAIREAFQTDGITIQWTIDRSTIIKPVDERHKEIQYPAIPLTPLPDILTKVNTQDTIDILAIVVRVKAPRSATAKCIPVQDLIVIQQEMNPMPLRLWGDHALNEGPKLTPLRKNNVVTILCKRLRVSSFGGFSLSTNNSSYVQVEPDIPQARELQNWANHNVHDIQTTVDAWFNEELDPATRYNPQQELVPVAHITPDAKCTWVKVKISFENVKQDFYFHGCPECGAKTHAFLGELFHCNFCDTDQTAEPRSKLGAELGDASGVIKATLFQKVAEKFLNHTAADISKMDSEQLQALLIGAEAEVKDKEFIAEIRKSSINYTDGLSRYTVQSCFSTERLLQIEASRAEPESSAVQESAKKMTRKIAPIDVGSSSGTQSQTPADDSVDAEINEETSSEKLPTFKKLKLETSDSSA